MFHGFNQPITQGAIDLDLAPLASLQQACILQQSPACALTSTVHCRRLVCTLFISITPCQVHPFTHLVIPEHLLCWLLGQTQRSNPQVPAFKQEFMAGCGKTDDILSLRPAKGLQPGE